MNIEHFKKQQEVDKTKDFTGKLESAINGENGYFFLLAVKENGGMSLEGSTNGFSNVEVMKVLNTLANHHISITEEKIKGN